MKRSLAALCLLVLSVHCEKEKPQALLIEETLPAVTVPLPSPVWEHTLAVLPDDGKGDGLFRRFQESLAAQWVSPDWKTVDDPGMIEAGGWTLTGRTAHQSGRIRLALSLSDDRGSRVFQETWEGPEEETLVIMEEAGTHVALALNPQAAPTRLYSDSIRLDGRILSGWRLMEAADHDSIQAAVILYKNVLRDDSTQVQAHLGLARAYLQIIENGRERRLVWLHLSRQAVKKALSMKPRLAAAHSLNGKISLLLGDLREAEAGFRKALHIGPSQFEAWDGLSLVLSAYGLYEPGLEAIDRALALRASTEVLQRRAAILMGLGRYDEAEESLQRALNIDPDASRSAVLLALNDLYRNRMRSAQRHLARADEPDALGLAVRAMLEIRSGNQDEGLAILELEVKPRTGNDSGLAVAVAAIYALLKQNGQSMHWLEKASQWGYMEYPWLMRDPHFREMHTDPRFQNYMADLRTAWNRRMKNYQPPAGPAD